MPKVHPGSKFVVFCLAALGLVALDGARPSRAAELPHLTLKELMAKTAAVIVGRVTAIDARPKSLHASGMPLTKVTFAVEEVVAGTLATKSISFEIPGGYCPKTGRLLEVSGLPQFEPDQSYVLFLRGGTWEYSPFTNWAGAVLKKTNIAGRPYLIDQRGQGVSHIDADGIRVAGEVEDGPSGRYQERVLGISGSQVLSGGVAGTAAERKARFAENLKRSADATALVRGLREQAGKLARSPDVLITTTPTTSDPVDEAEAERRTAHKRRISGL